MNALGEMAKRLVADAAPFEAGQQEAHLALVRAAVARLGWGTMLYACEACGFEWEVWLSLGVEGPPALREESLYVAAPFMVRCPAWPNMTPCPGKMPHVRWADDREFEARPIPDDAPRFVLPYSGGDGATLEIPGPALVRARRALNGETS